MIYRIEIDVEKLAKDLEADEAAAALEHLAKRIRIRGPIEYLIRDGRGEMVGWAAMSFDTE